MTKKELIANLAKAGGVTQDQAGKVLAEFENSVTNTLKKGDDVVLPGFGSFKVSDRAARTGRNPQTGATIQIAASKAAKFSAGKNLKEALNKK